MENGSASPKVSIFFIRFRGAVRRISTVNARRIYGGNEADVSCFFHGIE